MITPNFLSDEFVDQNIFNAAMAQLVSSIRETGANDTFIIPGVINPNALLVTTNGTLQVSVTTPNIGTGAFKCFFQTGAITAGFGMTNGVSISTYTVDFASLIPGVGSVTAYIVAQYAQISEVSTTIIGPPPGHPDYSANFIPYIGYTQLQDTLNIFATTTAPDNQTSIELARTTLVAGQTQVNTIDTSHQVLAHVNANTTLVGDVTGPNSNNRISNLQGDPVNTTGRTPNNALVWNGSFWGPVALPNALPPSGPAGGDLTGNYPNPQVQQSTTSLFTANAIRALANITALGNVIAAPATVGNEAIILSQLGSISATAPVNPTTSGDIYHQSFQIPILKGGTLAYIIVNFGFYSFYGLSIGSVGNHYAAVTYATPFTTGPLWSANGFSTNDFSNTGFGSFVGANLVIETPNLMKPGASLTATNFYVDEVNQNGGGVIHIAGFPNGSSLGILGFWWIIAGI